MAAIGENFFQYVERWADDLSDDLDSLEKRDVDLEHYLEVLEARITALEP